MSLPPLTEQPALVSLSTLRSNTKNPRKIRDSRLEKLVASIKQLPAMMELRPIVVDGDGVVIGGNMRFRALTAAGYTEIPASWVRSAAGMTAEERRRFVIADNVSSGTWDDELIADDWTHAELDAWGLEQYGVAPMSAAELSGFFNDPKDQPEPTEPAEKVMVLHFAADDYAAVTATVKAMGRPIERVLLDALGIKVVVA